MKVRSLPIFYSPVGFQKLAVSSTAVGFTLPVTAHNTSNTDWTRAAIFTVETAQVRFRVDGTDPDSTTGILLKPGDLVQITNTDMLAHFKVIRVSADATLQIHYFGGGF